MSPVANRSVEPSGGLVYSAFVLGVLNSVLLLVLLVLQIYLIFSLK